jgi:LAO/AO transport system kinase
MKKDSLKIQKGISRPGSINPEILQRKKVGKKENPDEEILFKGIRDGNIQMLSKAITIIESTLTENKKAGERILDKCLPFSGNSLRIGISGIPGVGKSTFIEALGMYLIGRGKKVAVLAVDPSSDRSLGSILGDKTRMLKLSAEKNAFIRPSPSGGNLGGIARKTRESIVLCEAAGFDIVFIETVGVGQSETSVHSMTDFFLVLMLAGAGDELQGIKRGIMELADMLIINKTDSFSKAQVHASLQDLKNALHLFPAHDHGWEVRVDACSSIDSKGIDSIWNSIEEYFQYSMTHNYFHQKRREQLKFWFQENIKNELQNRFLETKGVKEALKNYENMVLHNKISPFNAATALLEKYFFKED